MEDCWIALQSPDGREFRTVPAGDQRSLTVLQTRGWTPVRIFRARLPWPARQRLESCAHGHAETRR